MNPQKGGELQRRNKEPCKTVNDQTLGKGRFLRGVTQKFIQSTKSLHTLLSARACPQTYTKNVIS